MILFHAIAGDTCGQQVAFRSRCWLLDWNYRHKSVATQISHNVFKSLQNVPANLHYLPYFTVSNSFLYSSLQNVPVKLHYFSYFTISNYFFYSLPSFPVNVYYFP